MNISPLPADRATASAALEQPAADVHDWPFPPLLSGGWVAMPLEGAQPCRIETRSGAEVDGELLGLDLAAQTVQFRTGPDGGTVRLGFARIRSVALTHPVYLEESASLEHRDARARGANECRFHLVWNDTRRESYDGITAGYLATDDGLFLYPTRDDFESCARVFVPRSAYLAFEAAEVAVALETPGGIAHRDALLAALDAQETAPPLRIGESLVDLGLLTRPQLDYALLAQKPDVALGEMLVAAGTISRPDLLTALAHKMGYPFVDLLRFPIDAHAAGLLPAATAALFCALPIAVDGERLVVVADRPTSVARLRDLPAMAGLRIAIAIAPAARIREAIARLPRPRA